MLGTSEVITLAASQTAVPNHSIGRCDCNEVWFFDNVLLFKNVTKLSNVSTFLILIGQKEEKVLEESQKDSHKNFFGHYGIPKGLP